MDIVSFAHGNGRLAVETLSRPEQKRLGQFMTPPAIARLMAQRALSGLDGEVVRILEPAAGSGVLAAAAIETLLSRPSPPARIELVLCEFDERLASSLRRLGDRIRQACHCAGVGISVSVRIADFLLSNVCQAAATFDLVIANPPYFKLPKSDLRVKQHLYAVHGQPNIYGLFMAACARLVRPHGRWCFITPRSWTNGAYFIAARREIVRCLELDAFHIFESRQAHFTDDEVLQEAMITWATARSRTSGLVTVSVSEGIRDLEAATLRTLPAAEVIAPGDDNLIFLPSSATTSRVRAFKANLAAHGLKVSTGPVVAFRAAEHIAPTRTKRTVPLLWMQHILPMRVQWPIGKKNEHMVASASSAWMLVPNKTMVVLRRFSPKEDDRRIIAAPYVADFLPGNVLGLENHTNYIYRPGGQISVHEARGLAAFLNSRMVDEYLRMVAGNTQVNAADLRVLPLPSIGDLILIGQAVDNDPNLDDIDAAVRRVVGLDLTAQAA